MNQSRDVRWLVKSAVLAMHDALIVDHGGTPGIRDDGLLESALTRPQHLYHYEPNCSHFQLAAAYGFGLSSNHAFVDGNKRIALTAIAVFLLINGWQLEASEADAVVAITELAAGTLSEEGLAAWIEKNNARKQ
jgi:death on curing protein